MRTQIIFDGCVHFLEWLGALCGLTYVEINVLVFCILLPFVLFVLITCIIASNLKCKKLERRLKHLHQKVCYFEGLRPFEKITRCLDEADAETDTRG